MTARLLGDARPQTPERDATSGGKFPPPRRSRAVSQQPVTSPRRLDVAPAFYSVPLFVHFAGRRTVRGTPPTGRCECAEGPLGAKRAIYPASLLGNATFQNTTHARARSPAWLPATLEVKPL
ncbi:unnamed protein product [Lampetra fluviatilis]